MKLFLLCIALFVFGISQAQETVTENGSDQKIGKLNINQDPRIEEMVEKHIEKNKTQNTLKGFRIEIFSSSDLNAKNKAIAKKAEFNALFPDKEVYLKFISPKFSVRVGDFRTKSDALKAFKRIQASFPGSFIIDDNIKFPSLNPANYE